MSNGRMKMGGGGCHIGDRPTPTLEWRGARPYFCPPTPQLSRTFLLNEQTKQFLVYPVVENSYPLQLRRQLYLSLVFKVK